MKGRNRGGLSETIRTKVDAETKQRLDRYADKVDRPESAVIRIALREYLQKVKA